MTRQKGGRRGEGSGEIRGLAGPKAEKPVSLALQGGGAHGAFTWGVLDALIEDGRLAFEAISGASAGAMNAVVMAEGWAEGGPDGARSALETFWRHVSLDGGLCEAERNVFDQILNSWSPSGSPFGAWLNIWSSSLSPYDTNPFDLNPLRDVLVQLVDFDRLRAADVKLFVSATNVWTGKIRIFERAELQPDHLMASACLPTVFKAVEIDGEPYWDGGYMGNPALFPLFYGVGTSDVLLVQINPIERRETPRQVQEIHNRLNEITFNGGLLRELRQIEFVTRLLDEGKLSTTEYKRVLMHRVNGGAKIDAYTAATRSKAELGFFLELRDLGRSTAKEWLAKNYKAIGKHATLDLKAAYS
jgi:NTE family protein